MPERVPDEVLTVFQKLRVSDVSDGMDYCGLRDVGLVDRALRPIWLGARIAGRALTVRCIPHNRTVPTMTPEEYASYCGEWYRNKCPSPFLNEARKGDVLVVDMAGAEVGLWGSNIALGAERAGIVGAVLDGGCRDTAEIALQRNPVWARHVARTTTIGRLELESWNTRVDCGGVAVEPGDIVVADDDGVIVVPQFAAADVAKWALKELEGDKQGRRRHYEATGRELDDTVR